MDPTSITFAVKLTHDLDDRFNVVGRARVALACTVCKAVVVSL